MFTKPTVFILGAGASWHYGYPTGEALVRAVCDKSQVVRRFFALSKTHTAPLPKYVENKLDGTLPRTYETIDDAWKRAAADCDDLLKRLNAVDPPVIDYFLGQNPSIAEIGTLLIAWVILECETQATKYPNINRRTKNPATGRFEFAQGTDNWSRFIVHKIVSDCSKSEDILKNKVTFVTFNYDLSLEQKIRGALEEIEIFKRTDIDAFMSDNRFIHVYGSVRHLNGPFTPMDMEASDDLVRMERMSYERGYPLQSHNRLVSLIDTVHKSSQDIRTIDPYGKNFNEENLGAARNALSAAQMFYMLGFGFDENNCRRIDIENALLPNGKAKRKKVHFTNYEDVNRVNKAASRLFFGHSDWLGPGTFMGKTPTGALICEKSIRDCYEALAFDFDDF